MDVLEEAPTEAHALPRAEDADHVQVNVLDPREEGPACLREGLVSRAGHRTEVFPDLLSKRAQWIWALFLVEG